MARCLAGYSSLGAEVPAVPSIGGIACNLGVGTCRCWRGIDGFIFEFGKRGDVSAARANLIVVGFVLAEWRLAMYMAENFRNRAVRL